MAKIAMKLCRIQTKNGPGTWPGPDIADRKGQLPLPLLASLTWEVSSLSSLLEGDERAAIVAKIDTQAGLDFMRRHVVELNSCIPDSGAIKDIAL